ncbi:hypothetical protein C0Q70_15422 [Pomacea canaliculata]|uniref:MACPF domain-containing protein n=1 Tax=Pomacea canaliculata TaxID=400727 RepID=A0A2T7NUR8_POMCA|nr:macrophage-expressed gene 1 protein-like [Pomacea canaliculata]XP_025108203.1 macrophage-expressed gene 1 protein-like [Pomacea canaliculata]PVD24928.1 hypothetical protein C0Q70_15422 [Pomacea canaliculata]
MASSLVLAFVVVGLVNCAISSPDNNVESMVGSVTDYPVGDPRRCFEMARKNGYKMAGFEVLPGFGWDNLRNVDQGQVVNFNYSQCRTTDDMRFLLPDSVSTVPVKTSSVAIFAELFTHWSNWTSTTSKSINVEAGLDLSKVAISGKFSDSFQDMKSKAIGDKSMATRSQVRYTRYVVQLQPDSPLHPTFRGRLLDIAAAHQLNQTKMARYLSQLLVRDFGTHVVTRAEAGATLVQVDHLKEDWVTKYADQKSSILAAASVTLFSVFHMSVSYGTSTDNSFTTSYQTNRTSSVVKTMGGPSYRPSNFTPDAWAVLVDGDLVAVDRAGDPLHFIVTSTALPELPASTLAQVAGSVQEAVDAYYSFNTIPGCMNPSSPNFAPAANIEDGSCHPIVSNMTFGGVFQTCTMSPNSNDGDLCQGMSQVNPLTGTYSCPPNYQPVLLHSDTMQTSRSVHSCHSCWLFFHCCHDDYYHSEGTYSMYWCAASGPIPDHTGYLFGGLYTSHVANGVTQSMSCPPTFFALKLGSGLDLHVCVSDDFELGTENAVPFAGFISCAAGNPLVVGGKPGSEKSLQASHNLRSFFQDKPSSWPKRCPDNYSKHLATIDGGCQIDYCVQTGALAGPVLPPVKRPPFMPSPALPPPDKDTLIVFDPSTRTWHKNEKAQALMAELTKSKGASVTDSSTESPSRSGSTVSLSAGAAAGISVAATLACVVIATLAVLAVRARRRRGAEGYRRLPNSIFDDRGQSYGSVNAQSSAVGGDSAVVVVPPEQ